MLTPAFYTHIGTLNAAELTRLYVRIYRRIGHGWDAPTLRVVHPHIYAAMRAIAQRHADLVCA